MSSGKRVGPDLATVAHLGEPIAIVAAMWDHAPSMDHELRARNLPWPRLDQGDAADLTAFLLTRRPPPETAAAPPPAR